VDNGGGGGAIESNEGAYKSTIGENLNSRINHYTDC
jgi:hypothetical protein